MNQKSNDGGFLPIILGPTASGKTQLAVALAKQLSGEIISADSRQVYRGMNIGTGKDYSEYLLNDQHINYHLIDILDAGEKYDVSQFKNDCLNAVSDIQQRGKTPVICGGTGLYIEALLRDFNTLDVPPNEALRNKLHEKSTEELLEILNRISPNHNVDVSTRKRIIRGIEVFSVNSEQLTVNKEQLTVNNDYVPEIVEQKSPPRRGAEGGVGNASVVGHLLKNQRLRNYKLFCLNPSVELRREKITKRLRQRLDNEGLIEEVEGLLQSGLTPNQLIYYGLEYKFITEYLQGSYTKTELFDRLNAAIHRFAKRQMTFFRSMEKRGLEINWINGDLTTAERLEAILNPIPSFSPTMGKGVISGA